MYSVCTILSLRSSVAASSEIECVQKKVSKGSVSSSATDTKTTTKEKSIQSTSTSATSVTAEARVEQQRHLSTTSHEAATASTSASSDAAGAQMESEPVQRRVSKSRARFQIESRTRSRLEDSGEDPSISEIKAQLDEYRGTHRTTNEHVECCKNALPQRLLSALGKAWKMTLVFLFICLSTVSV